MDTDIAKLPVTTFSGRRVNRRQLEDVKWTVENITHSSRNDLARTICEHLNWRTKKGDDKIKACLASPAPSASISTGAPKRATTRSRPAWPCSRRWRRRGS